MTDYWPRQATCIHIDQIPTANLTMQSESPRSAILCHRGDRVKFTITPEHDGRYDLYLNCMVISADWAWVTFRLDGGGMHRTRTFGIPNTGWAKFVAFPFVDLRAGVRYEFEFNNREYEVLTWQPLNGGGPHEDARIGDSNIRIFRLRAILRRLRPFQIRDMITQHVQDAACRGMDHFQNDPHRRMLTDDDYVILCHRGDQVIWEVEIPGSGEYNLDLECATLSPDATLSLRDLTLPDSPFEMATCNIPGWTGGLPADWDDLNLWRWLRLGLVYSGPRRNKRFEFRLREGETLRYKRVGSGDNYMKPIGRTIESRIGDSNVAIRRLRVTRR